MLLLFFFAAVYAKLTCSAFEWAGQPPKLSLFVRDFDPHLIYGSLDPHESAPKRNISIGSAVFAGVTNSASRT